MLLPVYTNEGKAFINNLYISVKEEMTQSSRGVTIYKRAPAVGISKENEKNVRGEIIFLK